MTYQAELNEREVLIDFNSYFGQIEIVKVTDIETGDAIADEVNDIVLEELHEVAAGVEYLPLENSY